MHGLMVQGVGMAGLLALSACNGAPLRDAYALRKVDPVTTDVQALRVAVAVPDTIRPTQEAVEMVASLTSPGGVAQMYTFDLIPIPNTPDLAKVAEDQPADMQVYGFRIVPDDIAAFEAFRTKARANKEDDGQGSLTVDPKLCHEGAAPPDPLPLVIYLKTAELDRFVVLNSVKNLREDVTDQDLRIVAPPCS